MYRPRAEPKQEIQLVERARASPTLLALRDEGFEKRIGNHPFLTNAASKPPLAR